MNPETINRNTINGFTRYMEANPFYFRSVFGSKTISEVWAEIRKIKNDFMTHDFVISNENFLTLNNEEEGKWRE